MDHKMLIQVIKHEHHHDLRICSECKHLQAAVTWWCKHPSDEIGPRSRHRWQSLDCKYWEPCQKWSELRPIRDKLFGGYIVRDKLDDEND